MLDLSNARLLGKGSSRACYVHPEDLSKCVKVIHTHRHEIMDEELKYYRRYQSRGISYEMLAQWFGVIETTLGSGAVFTLARDYDGEISRPFESYLADRTDADMKAQLRDALVAFRVYLLQERINVRELKPDNLLFQRLSPASGKLVLIDGVGNNEFLPLADYSRIFLRRMLKKKWAKFAEMVAKGGGGDLLIA